jgi:hypothetical protein
MRQVRRILSKKLKDTLHVSWENHNSLSLEHDSEMKERQRTDNLALETVVSHKRCAILRSVAMIRVELWRIILENEGMASSSINTKL